jgi:geranylgeranyl pyrophosphate synthase
VLDDGGDPLRAVRAELDRLEAHLTDDDGIEFPVVVELLRYVFKAGGKRLRPALVFLAARLGAERADPDRVRDLAAAVETLHTATLVHDDLVDGSMLRRGLPTLNVRWSAGATVLAGDWLFARAAAFAADTEHVAVMKIFARTLGTLTNGELRQLFGRDGVPTEEEYAYRIYAKTASLFEAATEAAGALTGLPAEQVTALATYGRELGNAFQVVDDLLDYTGDPDRLGKPVGSDLRSGQVTLPVMRYLAHHPDAAPWLRDGGAVESADKDEVTALAEAVSRDAVALEETRAAARGHIGRALEALDALPAVEATRGLARIARYAIARDV